MKVCHIVGGFEDDDSEFGVADMDDVSWHPDAVNYVDNNGVMAGKGGGRFAPLDSFTIQESITVFDKME